MNHYTGAEVTAFVRSRLRDAEDATIKVSRKRGQYIIKIEQMYNFVPINFDFLMSLAEFFDTRKINDERYSASGCKSCDYGSSYEVTLTVGGDDEA